MRITAATVEGPDAEPVTVADIQAYARIDDENLAAGESDLIGGWITTARVAAEDYTRRSFITRTLRASVDIDARRAPWVPGYFQLPCDYFDSHLRGDIGLPLGPVLSVTSITTYDTLNAATAFNLSQYTLIGGRIVLNEGISWPQGLRTSHAAEIVYTAGYGPNPSDVPMPIRTAIAIHASRLYEGRGMCDGGEIPDPALRLLAPYRVF